jgi:hypothetical protein
MEARTLRRVVAPKMIMMMVVCHLLGICLLVYGSGIQTVFLGTPEFHGRLSGVPEAHFHYFEIGRYNINKFFLLSLFCPPLCA